MLTLLPPSPATFCVPWRGRSFVKEPTHGGRCCFCEREIAVPESARGLTASCIYCGMDRGLVPIVEIEPGS